MPFAHDVSTRRDEIIIAPQPYWLLGLAVLVAAAAWTVAFGRPVFPLDDAYITLHNAQVLREGTDPNYGVSPLIGATSSAHLLLVAALAGLVGISWGGAAATWLSIALYLSGLLFVARRCALPSLETAALLVLGACSGMSAYHLLNGLETGLAMAAVVWAMAFAAGPPTRLLPALLGVMPFIRPELSLLAGPLFIRQAWMRWRGGTPHAIIDDLAVLTLAAAPWLVWIWLETGSIIPQSIAAKRAYFAQAEQPWLVKAFLTFQALGPFVWHVGPLLLGLFALGKAPAGRIALLFIAAVLVLFGAAMPGGLHHNDSRYLYVLSPLLIVGLAHLGIQPAYRGWSWRTVLVVAAALYAIATTPMHLQRYVDDIAFTRTEHEGLAEWVQRNLPARARIAVHDAGYLAFATDRQLIDIVGLKTPNSRRVHEARTAPSGGADRGAALAQILLETQSEYVIVLRQWDSIFAITDGLRAAGVELAPVRTDGAYQVFRIRPSH
jgi:hypothetical protein